MPLARNLMALFVPDNLGQHFWREIVAHQRNACAGEASEAAERMTGSIDNAARNRNYGDGDRGECFNRTLRRVDVAPRITIGKGWGGKQEQQGKRKSHALKLGIHDSLYKSVTLTHLEVA